MGSLEEFDSTQKEALSDEQWREKTGRQGESRGKGHMCLQGSRGKKNRFLFVVLYGMNGDVKIYWILFC